jgi:D-amino-acid oxidase
VMDRLHGEALKRGIEMYRRTYDDIRELIKDYPIAKAFFNCTDLGSYRLKGVEDKLLYPSRVCLPLGPIS